MFSRRLATFLLGVWMGCCVLADVIALEGHRIATRILDVPVIEARTALTKAAEVPIGPLLHHLASEQVRAVLDNWEIAQLILVLLIVVPLVLTDQRKPLAIAMAAVMGLLVLVQHFGVSPELVVLGRSADFLAENAAFGVRSQIWTLTQIYGALEALKLVIGGLLASYFFAMESTVKRSSGKRSRTGEAAASVVERLAP